MSELLLQAAAAGELSRVRALLTGGADVLARNDGGLTALMMVKEKFYVDVINLLHEAGRDAGVGRGVARPRTRRVPKS